MQKQPYSSYIKELRKIIQSPVLFSHFSRGGTTLVCGNLFFYLIPIQYSEPSKRLSLVAKWSDGTQFFLKVNSYAKKIENEFKAHRLLEQYTERSFYVPKVLDFQQENLSGFFSDQYAWIVIEWVAGGNVFSDKPTHVELAAKTLAQINNIEIDLDLISGLFGNLPIQTISELKYTSRSGMQIDIEKAIQISDDYLNLELTKAAELFSKHTMRFSLNLNHGDFHLNNLLSLQSSGKYISAVIDWEDINLENPLYDLAHHLFLTENDLTDIFLNTYFRESRDLYSDFSCDEIEETIMAMFILWVSRNLRWKSRQMTTDSLKQYYYPIINRKLAMIRDIPWKKIIS
jgi:Ser/Thr protein kinase RdoA (MazF antagonist)